MEICGLSGYLGGNQPKDGWLAVSPGVICGNQPDLRPDILFSVPAISRLMFSLWRIMTIIGIATAAVSSGQRLAKFHSGLRAIAKISTRGKTTEAAIEPSEIYRQISTTTSQTRKAITAQMV